MDPRYAPSAPRTPSTSVVELRGRSAQSQSEGGVRAELTLDPHPGALGGEVGGFVDIASPHVASSRFRLTLYALHEDPSQDRSDSESVA